MTRQFPSLPRRVLALATLLPLICASAAMAEVSVRNGDFEEEPQNLNFFEIPQWGETGDSDFEDFLIAGEDALDGGQTAGFSPTGYIAQEIGTPGDYDFLHVVGDNYWRPNADETGQLRVAAFWLPAADPFEMPAFGEPDIESYISLQSVGGALGAELAEAPLSAGGVEPFEFTYDISALAADSRLFLRISSGSDQFAYVDNVDASLSKIPEPSSVVLLAIGMAGMAWAGRRRWRRGPAGS